MFTPETHQPLGGIWISRHAIETGFKGMQRAADDLRFAGAQPAGQSRGKIAGIGVHLKLAMRIELGHAPLLP
ncbi:MAG: hypothetical protein BGN95_20440 [Sphingomonas sp. 66-10]|nr:MAG: hypothetical protein BGN95_20440 [Sphingomonas sp. 66-10]